MPRGKTVARGKGVKRRRTARVNDNNRTAALSQTEHDVVPPRTQITTSNASGPSTTFNSSVDLPNNEESYSQNINEQGNANIHEITPIGDYELRVDLQDWEGQTWYAVYSSFRVGDESTKYTLSLGRYTGTTGDSLRYQNGMKFSTYDQDNDAYKAVDCVARDHAGWWYNQCHNVNINGLYKKGKSDKHNVVSWNLARGPYYSLKFVRMMIRRH